MIDFPALTSADVEQIAAAVAVVFATVWGVRMVIKLLLS
jgi:hypothetical protein